MRKRRRISGKDITKFSQKEPKSGWITTPENQNNGGKKMLYTITPHFLKE